MIVHDLKMADHNLTFAINLQHIVVKVLGRDMQNLISNLKFQLVMGDKAALSLSESTLKTNKVYPASYFSRLMANGKSFRCLPVAKYMF